MMKFQGIIFDMDGTLTIPVIDFDELRRKLGITSGDLVEVINSWPEPRRRAGWALVEEFEEDGARRNRLQPGMEEALADFQCQGLKLAVITRNSTKSAELLLERLNIRFDVVLTRDFPFMKPSPEPVWHVLRQWQMEPEAALMVGDYVHDLRSGRAAGTAVCYFRNPDGGPWEEYADYTVTSYDELARLIREHL